MKESEDWRHSEKKNTDDEEEMKIHESIEIMWKNSRVMQYSD